MTSDFTDEDANRLSLTEVIKFEGTNFVGNSFATVCSRLLKSEQDHIQEHFLLGTRNDLGELSSWCKPYQDGNSNIGDFVWYNLPESNKILVESKFTEDDAKNLQLQEVEVVKFQKTSFEDNSFDVLCDYLENSNSNKKMVHFVGVQFNEEMVEKICQTRLPLKIEHCSLIYSNESERKITLKRLNLSDENLNQVSVFFKDVGILSLGGNKFSNEAIRKLCDILKDNDNLKEVAFWSCKIEDEDVQYILPLVDKISEKLELNTNNIRNPENYRLLAERQRDSIHKPRIVINEDRDNIPEGAEEYCFFHYITKEFNEIYNVEKTPDWVYLKYEKESEETFRARQLAAVLSRQHFPT